MFTEQLSFIRESRRAETECLSRCRSEKQLVSQADLEYELCSSFMRHTGQRLSAKESELMEASRQLLQFYAAHRKKEVDTSVTLDTLLEDMTEASMGSQQRNVGLNRRNSSLLGSRKNLLLLGDQLGEIQERCSAATFAFFSSLVAEYKKLQSKIKQCEAREVAVAKREQQLGRLQEEAAILRKRLQQQQTRVKEVEGQVALLREQNRSINSCINEKITSLTSNHRYFEINHKVYRDIKAYIQQKEAVLIAQSQAINMTEAAVLTAIQDAFSGQSCSKCCQILRKLKDSIMRFKKYLEGESAQFERLYDKYKKTMYSVKSRPSA